MRRCDLLEGSDLILDAFLLHVQRDQDRCAIVLSTKPINERRTKRQSRRTHLVFIDIGAQLDGYVDTLEGLFKIAYPSKKVKSNTRPEKIEKNLRQRSRSPYYSTHASRRDVC